MHSASLVAHPNSSSKQRACASQLVGNARLSRLPKPMTMSNPSLIPSWPKLSHEILIARQQDGSSPLKRTLSIRSALQTLPAAAAPAAMMTAVTMHHPARIKATFSRSPRQRRLHPCQRQKKPKKRRLCPLLSNIFLWRSAIFTGFQ